MIHLPELLLCAAVLPGGPLVAATLEHASLPVAIKYSYATIPGESLETSLSMTPEADFDLEGSGIRVSARIRADGRDLLEPGKPDFESYSPASTPWALGDWGRIELRDVYLETTVGNHLFRVGKQQIVWGALDGLKVLDVLNPQNFREFILEDFGSSRIGLWSAYADFLFGRWRAEIAWLPDTTAHEVPEPGAWFELTAPRFRYGSEPDTPGIPLTTDRPGWDDAAVGTRLSRSFGRIDLSAQFVSGIDFEPLGRVAASDGSPVVERYYRRRLLYGAKAETAFARFALRLEVSYQPDRTFNTRSGVRLDARRLDQWRAGMGVDVDGPFGVFLNAQYLHDQVVNSPADLIRPAIDRVLTVSARRQFAYDRLALELRWYGELEQGDGMARGSISYALGTNTTLTLSADGFYGNADGLFGQFRERDRVQIALSHAF